MVGQLQGDRHGGVRNRDHRVDLEVRHFAADLVTELLAHQQAGLVDAGTVDDRIRAGEIHVFKNAWRTRMRFGAVAGRTGTVKTHHHGLARQHVALALEAETVQRNRFAGEDVFSSLRAIVPAHDQRTDTVRITEGHKAKAGDQHHYGVGPAHALVDFDDGIEDGVFAQFAAVNLLLQLVREHVEQHFTVRVGVDVAQVLPEHCLFQLGGIGQVAVVRQHDAVGRVDVERLRFGQVAGRAGGRITHMPDPGVAHQGAHVAGAEHVTHHAAAFVHVKAVAVAGHDAGCILPAVLKDLQPVIQELIDGRFAHYTNDPTHDLTFSR